MNIAMSSCSFSFDKAINIFVIYGVASINGKGVEQAVHKRYDFGKKLRKRQRC